MKIIKSVRIEGFRSIGSELLEDVGNHTVVIGKNSSGKSNVLRALSLFFNGEVNPGQALEFERDLHFRPTRKQKKRIVVEIDFHLPERFNFRSGLGRLEALGPTFTIRKTWALDNLRNVALQIDVITNDKQLVDSSEHIARDFLSLITFRYIPNRTVPAEMLRDESQAVASAIFRKLKESDKAADVLQGLSASAGRLLAKTASALATSGAPIASPNIATASTLGDMLRMSGFQASGLNGVSVRDEDWGAGHQAFFLLNLLKDIDTDYSRQFGWRQACVWAVEEPESGLHHDLQSHLAQQFHDWSKEISARLQIFTTTHSPVIAMSGDKGFWVEVGETSSVIKGMNTADLVRSAESKGVTGYMHPILSFPFNPVVLVEGWVDERVLNHVANVMGRGVIKFLSLPSIDDDEQAGVENQINYIRRNAALLSRRPQEAPLLVLVDWDVSDQKLNTLRSVYGANSDKYVIRANAAETSSVLGRSFRGVERFYPEAVIKEAHDQGKIAVAFPANDGEAWSVERDVLQRAKADLSSRILQIRDPALLGKLPRLVESVYAASTSVASNQLRLLA